MEVARFVATFVVAALFPLAAPASAQYPKVRVYSESNGLPSAQVRSLAADRSGCVWALTRNGLTFFDGQFMTPVAPPKGLTSYELGSLTQDDRGRIWLAANHLPPRVALYYERQWQVLPRPQPRGGGFGQVTDLLVDAPETGDEAVDSFVAVATLQGGLWIWWSGGWSQWTEEDGLPSSRVLSLAGSSKELFIGTAEGLAVLRGSTIHRVGNQRGKLSRDPILALARPLDGPAGENLWVLAPSWLGLLHRATETLTPVADGFQLDIVPPMGRASGLGIVVDDGPEGLYFGGPVSSFFKDPHSGRVQVLGTLAGLPAEGISAGLRDRSGGVWLASIRGLGHIASRRFLVLDRRSGLPEPEVTALLETAGGDLIIGQNQSLSRFDGKAVTPLPLGPTELDSLPLTRIMELAEDREGNVYIAAQDRGLGRLSPRGRLTWFGPRHGLGPEVFSVAVDGGTTWAACGDGGLFRSSGGSSFVREDFGESSPSFARRVFLGAGGEVFLASTEGLWVRRGGSWFLAVSERGGELDNVYAALPRSSGDILVGTASGIARLEEGALIALPLHGDLTQRPIFTMLEDRAGNLWLGTDRGIIRWDGSDLLQLTASHGLPGRDVNRGAFLEDRQGRIWIGTDSGASVYDPARDLGKDVPPAAEVSLVEASGETLPGIQGVRLPHHQNHLFFHVRGIDLQAEERLLGQYRLEGFDRTWTEPMPIPRAPIRYTNLPPGEYSFRFRVGRRNGEWSRNVIAGPYLIRSPVWQRRWFQLLALASLALLGWWVFHSYASRHRAALHDALTGLPNRTFFVERLQTAVNRGLKDGASGYALLFLDVDRFKNVNDSLGHLAGDQLLEQIADRLRDCLQPQDLVARLGGDEFTILLEGVRTPKQAGAIAERLQRAFEAPFRLLNHEVFAGASIGIALGPGDYVDTTDILRDADIAMYRAKDRGRGCYEFFNPSMHATAVALLRLETELRRAIERTELVLLYQPILSLDTGHVASCEALLRWRHPRRGLLLPEDFLEVAEETGLILPIGEWVIQTACEQLSRWRQQGTVPRRGFRTSINLAPRQLARPDLADRIADILSNESISPEDIILEVTESTLIAQQDSAEWILERCRRLGIGLSLDDFGTGLSSLSKLQLLPVQEIKLDRSFIIQLESNSASREIVRTVVSLGTSLNMRVIAEGVETQGQAQLLRQLGCRWAQGFLFASPVPGERFDPSPVTLQLT